MSSRLNSFDWIASFYEPLSKVVFGNTLIKSQLHHVNEIRSRQTVLIVGGGAGEFLFELLRLKPDLVICYVEASKKMLDKARRKIGEISRVEFIHGTHEDISHRTFDVLITNFVLDVFTEVELHQVVSVLAKVLTPGGKWLTTDFQESDKLGHRLLLRMMYLFFRLTKSVDANGLSDWSRAITNQGFQVASHASYLRGFITSSLFLKK